jgi:hypothetical protein
MALGLAAALSGCGGRNTFDIPPGSDVTVEKTDGVTVAGRLVEVKPEQVILESRDGVKTPVPRAQIASIRATVASAASTDRARTTGTPPAPATQEAPAAPAAPEPETKTADTPNDEKLAYAKGAAPAAPSERKPEFREVTLPAGTALTIQLTTMVGSDTSRVEDAVRGTLHNAVRIDGLEALPVGTAVLGHVTNAQPAGKVKGVASIGFRFNTIELPRGGTESISTATYTRSARTTRRKDAAKIGIGAGAGAVVGGIIGGGSGAAKGAAIGGGAGTAVVLSTTGDEVRIPAGTSVTIKLSAPLTMMAKTRD